MGSLVGEGVPVLVRTGRDPRVKPRAGDVVSNGWNAVLVTEIEGSADVLCLRYPGPEPTASPLFCVPVRLCLDVYREACSADRVVVLAEGLP